MHLLARLAPLILALTLVSVSTHAGTIPVDAGLEPTNPEKPIDGESIALGSGFAAANGTTSVGPGGTVSAIVRLLEDPPVPFFALLLSFPYNDSILEPILSDESDPGQGFKTCGFPPWDDHLTLLANDPTPGSVTVSLITLTGVDGAAGDLMCVEFRVIAGSLEVPVSIPFTVTEVTDLDGINLVGSARPQLDVVLVPEPSTVLLVACGLAGLAVRRRSSGP